MTLRRDLEMLERERFIIRTKGGARVLPSTYGVTEDIYGERENRNYAQKQLIGGKAASLIETECGIFIDAGTTAMAFARQIPDVNAAVITAAPNVALELALKKQNPSVFLIGGTLSRKTISISGFDVLEQLKNLNIDTAFMCTSGFTRDSGFSVGNQHECELKRMVVKAARRVVMLLDTSKIGVLMPFTFARISDIDTLVTDDDIPKDITKYFKDNKINII